MPSFQKPMRQPYGSPRGRNPADLATTVPAYGISLPMGDQAGYTQAGEPSTRMYLSVNVQEQSSSHHNPFPFPSFPADQRARKRSPPKKRGRTLRQRQLTTMEDILLLTVSSTPNNASGRSRCQGSKLSSRTRQPILTNSKDDGLSSFMSTPTHLKRPQTASYAPKSARGAIYGGGWKNRPKTARNKKTRSYSNTKSTSNMRVAATTSTSTSTSASAIGGSSRPTRLKRRNQRNQRQHRQSRPETTTMMPTTTTTTTMSTPTTTTPPQPSSLALSASSASSAFSAAPSAAPSAASSAATATFVSIELDSMHNYSAVNGRGKRTGVVDRERGRGRGRRRAASSNKELIQRGWRKPKKIPTYTRVGGTGRTTAFGYHREFTPVRPRYFSTSQHGVVRISTQDVPKRQSEPQRQISVVNVNVSVSRLSNPTTTTTTTASATIATIDTTIDITPTASVAFVGVEEVQAIRSIRKIRKEYMIASTIVASIVSDALQSVMHSVGAIQSINNKNHQ